MLIDKSSFQELDVSNKKKKLKGSRAKKEGKKYTQTNRTDDNSFF